MYSFFASVVLLTEFLSCICKSTSSNNICCSNLNFSIPNLLPSLAISSFNFVIAAFLSFSSLMVALISFCLVILKAFSALVSLSITAIVSSAACFLNSLISLSDLPSSSAFLRAKSRLL